MWSRYSAELLGCSLFFYWSLRFMSKQDNRSSGMYCFPFSLRSLHADISGFVASKYTHF